MPVSGQGTWESTLQSRDLDGNLATVEAYYDTVLNITWLADANFAQTSGFDPDGLMVWATANTWAAGFNVNGITGWRLPTVSPGSGLTNTALFANVQTGRYWSSTEYTLSTGNAWSFSSTVSSSGLQGNTDKTSGLYAWAVHSGDVAVVPAPAAVWLLATALMGFAGVARQRRG